MTPGWLIVERADGEIMRRIPCETMPYMLSYWCGWISAQMADGAECTAAPGHAISSAGRVIYAEPSLDALGAWTLPHWLMSPVGAPGHEWDNRVRGRVR